MKKIILTKLLFLFTVALFAQQMKPTIAFTEMVYDYKDIPEAGGKVEHIFNFTNTGNQPLVIHNVQASCGCTTPDWTKTPIQPGAKGFVKATYDPTNRPGQFNKTITVMSNAEQPSMVLRIIGNVTPKPKTVTDEFPRAFGDLRAKGQSLSFTKIAPSQKKTETIEVINTSAADMKVEFIGVPAHLGISMNPAVLKAGQRGVIVGTFDAAKRQDWGFVMDNVSLSINGVQDPNNRLSVNATIEEDFSTMTPEQLANAPVASFDAVNFSFGEIAQNTKVSHQFVLTNTGKTNLIVRKVRASCGCTAAAPQKSIIEPGQSTTIDVQFDSTGRSGQQNKSITVVTNDPKASTVILMFTANIVADKK
ncbi:MAG: DUF1573 domain-containing protein [Breznakibacter sp.]|nr:DUF1573 domain-containing protein [Breznakibacter sp.]